MTFQLYDYQQEAIDDLFSRWAAGAVRVPSVLATGLGKTEIFTAVIERWMVENPGRRVLVIAHMNELIAQAAAKIRQRNPRRRVGIVKGGQNQTTAEVIVSSRQTLINFKRRDQLRRVGLIVIDECFPAGTMVGDKRIEDLRPGDLVPSWDEVTGRHVMRPVVATMSKRPSAMVRVTLDSGESFTCTPNHPILTNEGWCPAGILWRGAPVVSFTHDAIEKGGQAEATMHPVRGGDRHAERAGSPVRHLAQDGASILSRSLPDSMGQCGFVGQNGADEQGACVGAHDRAQPDGAAGDPREDGGHPEGDRTQAAQAGRQRHGDSGTATTARGVSGVAHRDERSAGRWGASVSLQAGHRAPHNEGLRRGGRGIPFLAEAPRVRPSAGRTPGTSRVVDVQILEPGSDGTYGGVCPDGLVYNIEVADTHTYLIGDGVVAHNCHHAVRENSYGKILEHFGAFPEDGEAPGVLVAGFTATLIRGDKAKLSTVWEDCTFQRDILFGIKNGFLTDVKGERIVVEGFDKRNIAKSAGDYSESAAAEELERTFAVETIAKEYLRLAHDRQGLAFWPLVATAKHASEVFNDLGIPSAYVHGQMPDDEVHKVRLALRSGEIQVVHNAMKWTEGFDEPCVEAVVIGRPTRSPVTYVQIVGRGLRRRRGEGWPEGGYQRPCLLLDAVGAGEECSLTPGVDLSPERRAEIDEQYPDATLSELEDLYAEAIEEEIEQQRAGASFLFESDEYTGATETKTFDPLQRERIWGRTAAGNYFIRASRFGKGDAFIFIVPSLSGPEGTFDIAGCSVNTGYIPERDVAPEWVSGFPALVGMELDQALLHGEELAGTSYNNRKSSWRNRPPGKSIKFEAYHLGIKSGGKTHGELQDEVFAALADRRIDPLVDKVRDGM